MASQNKIIEMIGAIKTIYSYYAKETDVKLLVNTWTMLLQNYDDNIVEAAFYKCLQICKMPPTPADVIEQIQSMRKSVEPSDEELWIVYEKSLRLTWNQVQRFGETYVDSTGVSLGNQARKKVDGIWEGLPDKIKRYVASKGELMRLAREWNFDASFATWEKQRFMKSMPIMEKRQEFSALFLESGSNNLLLSEGE